MTIVVKSGKWEMDRQDDAEIFLDALKNMMQQEEESMQNEMDKLGRNMRMMYLGYIHAGFTAKQAMDLVKTILSSCTTGALKK